jgi:hypothetical protein
MLDQCGEPGKEVASPKFIPLNNILQKEYISIVFHGSTKEAIMKKLVFPVLILVLLGVVFAWQQSQSLPASAQESQPEAQTLQTQTGSLGAPTRVVVPMTDKPPIHSAEEIQRLEALSSEANLVLPSVPVGTTAVQRLDSNPGPETATQISEAVEYDPKAGINAPGDMVQFRKTIIHSENLGDMTSTIGSVSTANNSYVVIETGNWYAAVSADGGRNFKYIDPLTAFPADYGGFCCNQVVLYVPSRDMFIWEMEYSPSATEGGALRIAVSRGTDILDGIWYYYDLEAAAGNFYNFADLNLTNDYLVIPVMGFTSGGIFTESFIFCVNLDPLLAAGPFTFIYFHTPLFGIRGVHGATDTYYFAAHNSTSQVQGYKWVEGAGTASPFIINLSAAWFDDDRLCPGPDSKNWCGGLGQAGRILTGWVSNGMIGYLWGSSQGGSFVYPYIEAVTINESDLTYLGRPLIYNDYFAFIYPGASVNVRGDVAIVYSYGGNAHYPSIGLSVWDDFISPPPGWSFFPIANGTNGPNTNNWGRYNTVRAFAPTGFVWGGTSYVLNGCGDNECVDTVYFIYGRSRDMRSLTRYWEPRYGVFAPIVKK